MGKAPDLSSPPHGEPVSSPERGPQRPVTWRPRGDARNTACGDRAGAAREVGARESVARGFLPAKAENFDALASSDAERRPFESQ